MDGVVTRSGDDVLPIRGVNDRMHPVIMSFPAARTSLSIPDSTGRVVRSGGDVLEADRGVS